MMQLAIAVLSVLLLIWLERKIKARSQFRVGPPVYQQLADLAKLLGKQNLRNALASPLLNFLPIISLICIALIAFYLPLGGISGSIDMVTLIFFFALISFIYVVAGFASFSPYGFFGAKRELLQFISYEIPFMLSILSVGILYGRLDVSSMFKFSPFLIPAMVVYYLCALAKLRRSPFDMPNATQEIVEGPATEFSGLSLAAFHLAEWLEAFVLCSLFYILFIGMPNFWVHILSVFVIFVSMVFVDVMTPRLTIKDMVGFFWKFVLPLSMFGVVLCYLLTL